MRRNTMARRTTAATFEEPPMVEAIAAFVVGGRVVRRGAKFPPADELVQRLPLRFLPVDASEVGKARGARALEAVATETTDE